MIGCRLRILLLTAPWDLTSMVATKGSHKYPNLHAADFPASASSADERVMASDGCSISLLVVIPTNSGSKGRLIFGPSKLTEKLNSLLKTRTFNKKELLLDIFSFSQLRKIVFCCVSLPLIG